MKLQRISVARSSKSMKGGSLLIINITLTTAPLFFKQQIGLIAHSAKPDAVHGRHGRSRSTQLQQDIGYLLTILLSWLCGLHFQFSSQLKRFIFKDVPICSFYSFCFNMLSLRDFWFHPVFVLSDRFVSGISFVYNFKTLLQKKKRKKHI